jgi:predicted type IV restriction endonuclease
MRKILEKVNNENPSVDQLVSWLADAYGLSSGSTPHGYIRVVKDCLGFLEKVDGHLKITAAASRFLVTQDNKLVLDVLRERVLGFDEILSMLSDGRRLKLEEVNKELLEKCNVKWEKPNQALWRLNWLASLGYVDKEHGKYYLTKEGPTPPPPTPTPPTPIDEYLKRANDIIQKHPKMSELNTISTLIEPLLEVLGWNIRDPDEVQREYPIHMGERTEYVDIALKVNDKPVVFVEAKPVDTPLHDHLAEQPIKYANAEGVSWCMLTNGRELRVYNAFWKIRGIEQKMLFKLSIDEFKEKIDKLELLLKGNTASGKLDEEGEFEHAKRIASEWFKQKENNIVKDIMELDPSLKEEYVRKVLRKIL